MTPLCLRITAFWVREKCHNYLLDYFFLTFFSLATVRFIIAPTLEELFRFTSYLIVHKQLLRVCFKCFGGWRFAKEGLNVYLFGLPVHP